MKTIVTDENGNPLETVDGESLFSIPQLEESDLQGVEDEYYRQTGKQAQRVEICSSPEELAIDFSCKLYDELGRRCLQEVNERNEANNDEFSCASHDFCDANQIILDCMNGIFGPASEEITEFYNAAWDIAKSNKFFIRDRIGGYIAGKIAFGLASGFAAARYDESVVFSESTCWHSGGGCVHFLYRVESDGKIIGIHNSDDQITITGESWDSIDAYIQDEDKGLGYGESESISLAFRHQFPDYEYNGWLIGYLLGKGFEDVSWNNDANPIFQFGKEDENNLREYSVFVAEAYAADREEVDWDEFSVCKNVDGQWQSLPDKFKDARQVVELVCRDVLKCSPPAPPKVFEVGRFDGKAFDAHEIEKSTSSPYVWDDPFWIDEEAAKVDKIIRCYEIRERESSTVALYVIEYQEPTKYVVFYDPAK